MLDLIERKAQGEEIAVQPAAEEPAKVPDLMAALEESMEAVKDRGDAKGDGAPKKKPARKRPPAKKPTRAQGQEVALRATR